MLSEHYLVLSSDLHHLFLILFLGFYQISEFFDLLLIVETVEEVAYSDEALPSSFETGHVMIKFIKRKGDRLGQETFINGLLDHMR